MNEPVQTWHYGLMARHWAENNTTGPEVKAYRQLPQNSWAQCKHWMLNGE